MRIIAFAISSTASFNFIPRQTKKAGHGVCRARFTACVYSTTFDLLAPAAKAGEDLLSVYGTALSRALPKSAAIEGAARSLRSRGGRMMMMRPPLHEHV